jgi:hypothetical protein
MCHDIYYKISTEGHEDTCVALMEYNYKGDYDFNFNYPNEPDGTLKVFKPKLTKKDFEECEKVLRLWKKNEVYVPGASCLVDDHMIGNIYFDELVVGESGGICRIYDSPIEDFLDGLLPDKNEGVLQEDRQIQNSLEEKILTYDRVKRKLFVTISEEIPEDQVRLILFVNNWINSQEKKIKAKQKKEEIQEMESRIRKAEDALRGYESINQMKVDLNILKGNQK